MTEAPPKGTLKGMYQGAEPFQGNDPLDADGVAFRTWSWIAWQYRIDYQCYYSMGPASSNTTGDCWSAGPTARRTSRKERDE